jgi:hypothetical protein
VGKDGLRLLLSVLIWMIALVACTPLQVTPSVTVDSSTPLDFLTIATLTPFLPQENISLSTAPGAQVPGEAVQTLPPLQLWISPSIPVQLQQVAILSGLPLAGDSGTATVRLEVSEISDSQSATWIYALVAPFPTLTDGLSLADIQNTWSGAASGPFAGRSLWIDAPTLAAFSVIWGAPVSGAVRLAAADQLLDSAWSEDLAWALVPFELLDPRWKVLSVDGQSPIYKEFNPATYPLKISFRLQPATFPLPLTNRDPGKLTILAMTGTTALVRATADRMERYGVLYPGEEIRSVLQAADITHISNEVPFMPGCPVPDPWTNSLQFCSDPRYIALLEDVGTDIVELTGNHLLDYGPAAISITLDMYDQRGWEYFGGGRNLQDSLQPALLEDHGNKLAFVGCNIVGPPGDWATNDLPGSAPCDLDQLTIDISNLRSAGYLPIMTFQYNEYYQPNPTDYEQRDFRRMASAGAVIVSGSQAHMPAAAEFSGQAFIHYGLGNLFFDQMSHLKPDGTRIDDTRNVFVDRHVFYDGRYISTELLTYIIEDYARPRLMTGLERLELLQEIFTAAGW